MNTMSTHSFVSQTYALSPSAWKNGLDVEIDGQLSLLPNGGKCAIHFEADGKATIVLGTREYGQGFASAYFATLLSAKLGIDIKHIRVYYTGMQPAVRRTPRQSHQVWNRTNVGVINAKIGDLIEVLCDLATEKARRFLAMLVGVTPNLIDFDPAGGHFFAFREGQYFHILKIAKLARGDDVPALCVDAGLARSIDYDVLAALSEMPEPHCFNT